ncbi:MAG TPA: 30S ribosomal protein S5 [Candidatus Paceibacterota bacterium]|jgi:small subunit ribosomal protein S5|nr:30S ribosomal protein S5 [Candidatus Paceibacterota bacterium]
MTEPTKTTQKTNDRRGGGGAGGRRPRRDGRGGDAARVRDVEQKILDIRRVTRVVAGGRRMSFAVVMVIGDKNGVVGVGTGKGGDTALAINKALKDAKKHAIKIKRTDTFSIPFDVAAKYSASKVKLFPNDGRGIVAGAAVRDILSIGGLKDVSGKIVSGSKNPLNTARATIKALSAVGTKYIFGLQKATPVVAPAETVEAGVMPAPATGAEETK